MVSVKTCMDSLTDTRANNAIVQRAYKQIALLEELELLVASRQESC
jgi:hypothetical protein